MPKATDRDNTLKADSEASVIVLAPVDQADVFATMHFRVSAQFHHEFKLYAVQHNMSMVELLHESFRLLKAQNKR